MGEPALQQALTETVESRHRIRSARGRGLVWVRAWPVKGDMPAVRDDALQRYEDLLTELGDDVADLASIDSAATAHGQFVALAAYYVALAAKEGLDTRTGKETAQLAAYFHARAINAAKDARALAADIRAQRAKDVTADGRELFKGGGR